MTQPSEISPLTCILVLDGWREALQSQKKWFVSDERVYDAIRALIENSGPGGGTTAPQGETETTPGGPRTPPADASPGLSPEDDAALERLDDAIYEAQYGRMAGYDERFAQAKDLAALAHIRRRLEELARAALRYREAKEKADV